MSLPRFTAEASLYKTNEHYDKQGRFAASYSRQQKGATVKAAQALGLPADLDRGPLKEFKFPDGYCPRGWSGQYITTPGSRRCTKWAESPECLRWYRDPRTGEQICVQPGHGGGCIQWEFTPPVTTWICYPPWFR